MALAWLNVTGMRLGLLLARALGLETAAGTGWDELVVVDRQTRVVSLRMDPMLSDVQAFVAAATRCDCATPDGARNLDVGRYEFAALTGRAPIRRRRPPGAPAS